jgi:hypothetical protein
MKEEITETHKKIQELEANGGTVEELWLLFKTYGALCIILFTSLNFDVILGSADFFLLLYNLSLRRMNLLMFGVIHGRLSFCFAVL